MATTLADIKITIDPETISKLISTKEIFASAVLSSFDTLWSAKIYSGGSEVSGIMHKQHRVPMVIDVPGLANFTLAEMTEEQISDLIEDKSTAFRNKAFTRYKPGTKIIVTFRVTEGSGRRYVLSVVKASDVATKRIVEEEEDDFGIFGFDVPDGPKAKEEIQNFVFNKGDLDNFYIEPHTMTVFENTLLLMTANPSNAIKILAVGPSGYGKTSIGKLFADAHGLDYFRMNCASIRDPEEWFGTREASDGTTRFEPSLFVNKFTAGNVLIVLDEFNRLESDLHNTLYPLLDHDQRTHIYNTEFVVGPKTIFLATMNIGHEYTGTYQLDEANKNRFDMIFEVNKVPADREAEILAVRERISKSSAKKIVEVANKVRQSVPVHCSIRTTLFIARLVASEVSISNAFLSTLLHRIPEDLDLATTGRKELIDILRTCGLSL